MQVEFTEDEFRTIGREYQQRTENGDVEGKQVVEFHDGGDSMRPSQRRTDRREGRDDATHSESTGEASAGAEGGSDNFIERLKAWKEGGGEYL